MAWKFVWEFGYDMSKAEIMRASSASHGTVGEMRRRKKIMMENGIKYTGHWHVDMRDREDGDGRGPWPELTDEEHEAKVQKHAEALQKAAGYLPHNDTVTFADTLERAFGHHLRDAVDYLYSGQWDPESAVSPVTGVDGDTENTDF